MCMDQRELALSDFVTGAAGVVRYGKLRQKSASYLIDAASPASIGPDVVCTTGGLDWITVGAPTKPASISERSSPPSGGRFRGFSPQGERAIC
jgi:hypothetical protein